MAFAAHNKGRISLIRFYSSKIKDVTFKEALFQGFAPDGGLYLPQTLPLFSDEQFKQLAGLSFLEASKAIGKVLFSEIEGIEKRLESAFNFPVTIRQFPDQTFCLELFHGPTLSFKDFGARLMAELVDHFKGRDEELIILVATSGDTGSAVGHAFHGMKGVRVFILYPEGHVTPSQEQQITTIGGNIQAVEVKGGFESCQELVKKACLDPSLQKKIRVTTGNSINIGRLLSHTLYYFYVYSQICGPKDRAGVFFSIPCGNFGHLVAGMLAKKMGIPVIRFIGATNVNDEVPLFLRTGVFLPHQAFRTMSVSMDVGNPSNFPRMLEIYESSLKKIRSDLAGISFTDAEVRMQIQETFKETGYLLDPHTAIGYMGLKKYLQIAHANHPGAFFATAHPAKFPEALEPIIGETIPSPASLKNIFSKKKTLIKISDSYEELKKIIY